MDAGDWRMSTFAAVVVTVGGILLLPGLLTPRAAGAVMAATIDAWILLNGTNPIRLSGPTARDLPAGRNCHQTPNRDSMSS